jgi:hypothetical protein
VQPETLLFVTNSEEAERSITAFSEASPEIRESDAGYEA